LFDHIYAVSRDGKFLRHGEPFEGFGEKHKGGYLTVGRQRLAHRMVATCWCDRPPGATQVHHKNENKRDNRADNLEWLTAAEHQSDRHGDNPRGHKMSDAGKDRLRQLRLGSRTSEETKLKQRLANLRLGIKPPPAPKGVTMSPEGLRKAIECRFQPCIVDGVRYASFTEAGKARGERPHSLRKRCLSPNFSNYQLLPGSSGG